MPWPSTTISTVNLDATTDSPAAARPDLKALVDNVNTMQAARGASDGIASTDSTGKVPTGQLPTIPANQGGTGHTVFNVGDIFFANTTTTLQKLSAGANGNVLTSNGAGTAPSWQVAGGVPSGTRMPFNQTAAPTGWTKETNSLYNNATLRLVTGTTGAGGSIDFTSVFGGNTNAHALTLAQLPLTVSGTSLGGAPNTVNPTGTAAGHSHGIPSIKYVDFIIATKD